MTNNKGQEENLQDSKDFSSLNFSIKRKNTKAQEEIVGFALIIIIVAVIMLFLLSFSLNKTEKEEVESFEADSFVQSTLQYTVTCGYEPRTRTLSVQSLISECIQEEVCFEEDEDRDLPEVKSCQTLNTTLNEILAGSWPIGENRVVKGYDLRIAESGVEFLAVQGGSETTRYKGSLQTLPGNVAVTFKAYS